MEQIDAKTGRPRGSAKLTPDARRRLERDLLDGFVPLRDLAARFGLSHSTVADIKARVASKERRARVGNG